MLATDHETEPVTRVELRPYDGRPTSVFFVQGAINDEQLHELLAEPLLGELRIGPATPDDSAFEIAKRPGVTDSTAAELLHGAQRIGARVTAVATATRYRHQPPTPSQSIESVANELANPVIERWAIGAIEPAFVVVDTTPAVEVVPIRFLDEDGLLRLNTLRGLALDIEELRAIRAWFAEDDREPTDVELEMLAQTWSEHCSHKTFRARITTVDGQEIAPLMSQLRLATETLSAPFVLSAFVGNAGIVELNPGQPIAVKVETHNHPSAVEPFGGANTGVGGVVRDVMAAPAHPIALTDILCFGPLDLDESPAGVLHPRRIHEGVVAGVADYGNKLGVPTVAGAVLYDPGFTANPLVFCGCIGLVYAGATALDGPHPGDRVIVIGGATGRDGIRGATFSSMTMNATTGATAGASVQIGDPITEKRVMDVLAALLDRADPPVTSITDCGAGGLSSAIGEMAEHVGADVSLDRVPRKYPGLAPWEVWLSEAQERMVLAVNPTRFAEVKAVCRTHGVEIADLGSFTGDDVLTVRTLDRDTPGSEVVVSLPTKFLHDGRPIRHMIAMLPKPDRGPGATRIVADPRATLLQLLAHPNIASKQAIVHRYDHEVQGATVVRPLTGASDDGPSDATVVAPLARAGGPSPSPDRPNDAIAIGIGVNPWYALHDPEWMAHAVVDEAVRNVVCAGADLQRVALLDNFSWGNPRRPATLGALTAAVRGCVDASLAYRAPFVSGKDSLNNEFVGPDGELRSIPPTLVITAIAAVPNADAVVTSDLKRAGNVLLLVGSTGDELGGSHLDLTTGIDGGGSVPEPVDPDRYVAVHHAMQKGLIRAAHDCSEGGLAVALAEMAIGGRLGLEATLPGPDATCAFFAESNGRIVLEVETDHVGAVHALVSATVLGSVTVAPVVVMTADAWRVECTVDELRHAWGAQ